MAVAIARVFVVPAQCQARHDECRNNVYEPKEIIPPEGRLCIDCLFLDATSALPRLPSPETVRLALPVHMSSRSPKAVERREVASSECLEDRHIIFTVQI